MVIQRLLGTVALLLAACASTPPPKAATPRTSNTELAKAAVESYALDAFPAWVADHPDRECPAQLAELTAYTDKDTRDPWGTEYRMECTKLLAVGSAGEDRRFGTADDIWSNR